MDKESIADSGSSPAELDQMRRALADLRGEITALANAADVWNKNLKQRFEAVRSEIEATRSRAVSLGDEIRDGRAAWTKLTGDQAREVEERVSRRLWRSIAKIGVVMTALFGVGLWQAFSIMGSRIGEEVARRFSEPNVQATLTEVATNEASKILHDRVDPAVNDLEKNIADQRDQLAQSMTKVEQDVAAQRGQLNQSIGTVQGDIASLKSSATYFQELAKIQMMRDAAMLGDGHAFDSLVAYTTASPELRLAAKAQGQALMASFVGITNTAGIDLGEKDSLGNNIAAESLSTPRLIEILSIDPVAPRRAKAARLLRERREMRVVDALLAALDDDNLFVRHEALQSYGSFLDGKRTFGTLRFAKAKETAKEDRAYLAGEFPKER